MFSAVVFTAGRSGSHLIVDNLCSYFKSQRRSWWDDTFDCGIVHSHNPMYLPPNKNFICIINTRQNEFDAMVSMILTKRTNEFTYYSNKIIEPFAIPDYEFVDMYNYFKCFYKSICVDAFEKVVTIEYEPLITDSKYLFSKLDLNHDTLYNLKKSPYNYYNLIINLNEIKKLYLELINVEITDNQVENFKNTIAMDLENIRLKHNGNRNTNA